MNALEIIKILEGQHSNDVFISECKDGPTWFGGHARMDAWVCNRSWAKLCTTGYEIKVNRRDFQQDKKWHTYLPLCNQLYFVVPKGLIEPVEVPTGVGLKYATEKQVRTIVKASHREVVIPQELFFYILMSRVQIVSPHFHSPETHQQKMERFRKWKDQKVESRSLGHECGRAVAERVEFIHCENMRLKSDIEKYQDIKTVADRLGISSWMSEKTIEEKLLEFKQKVPRQFLKSLQSLRDQSTSFLAEYAK